jgi:hypothetical protein
MSITKASLWVSLRQMLYELNHIRRPARSYCTIDCCFRRNGSVKRYEHDRPSFRISHVEQNGSAIKRASRVYMQYQSMAELTANGHGVGDFTLRTRLIGRLSLGELTRTGLLYCRRGRREDSPVRRRTRSLPSELVRRRHSSRQSVGPVRTRRQGSSWTPCAWSDSYTQP